MSVNQKSGHGTMIAVQLYVSGAVQSTFTDIAEMGDVTPPALMRNEFDATTQNEDIDSRVMGVLRRGDFTVPLNFIPDNNTHDHITGLQKLIISNVITGFKVTFPQVTPSLVWIMSGAVKSFTPTAPVDGKLAATVVIGLSGRMWMGTTLVG